MAGGRTDRIAVLICSQTFCTRSMPKSALTAPAVDPTPIFEHFRGSYGTELLTAAVDHFDLFRRLAQQPRTLTELAGELGLAMRPAVVLVTAMRAMRLLEIDGGGRGPFRFVPATGPTAAYAHGVGRRTGPGDAAGGCACDGDAGDAAAGDRRRRPARADGNRRRVPVAGARVLRRRLRGTGGPIA